MGIDRVFASGLLELSLLLFQALVQLHSWTLRELSIEFIDWVLDSSKAKGWCDALNAIIGEHSAPSTCSFVDVGQTWGASIMSVRGILMGASAIGGWGVDRSSNGGIACWVCRGKSDMIGFIILLSPYTICVRLWNTSTGTNRWLELIPKGEKLQPLSRCWYFIGICIKVDTSTCGKEDNCPPLSKCTIGWRQGFLPEVLVEKICGWTFLQHHALLLVPILWENIIDILINPTWSKLEGAVASKVVLEWLRGVAYKKIEVEGGFLTHSSDAQVNDLMSLKAGLNRSKKEDHLTLFGICF